MKINQHTKISILIKENPDVIDAIVSINKHFEKLRNPILRKILASRVTIADAAKIGNTNIQAFYDKLSPLGFFCEMDTANDVKEKDLIPEFYKVLTKKKTQELDVREDLARCKDPFNKIMDVLAQMPDEYTLKLINTFEPTPLINLLQKKGYDHYTIRQSPVLVFTYLNYTEKKKAESTAKPIMPKISDNQEIEQLIKFYGEKIKAIDVRSLEMPLPMLTILNELAELPENTLLYVHHKKIPQFLLPEIAQRGYQWKINELSEGDVNNVEFDKEKEEIKIKITKAKEQKPKKSKKED